MSEKSELINKLKSNKKTRISYTKAHISVNIPSQIRALRRRRNDMTQKELAEEAGMLQPRISAMERPGETNYNVETLVRLAAALKVGLIVKFASFSEMLKWENEFGQDTFDVRSIDVDNEFLREEEEQPAAVALPMSAFRPDEQINVSSTKPTITAPNNRRRGFENPSIDPLASLASGMG